MTISRRAFLGGLAAAGVTGRFTVHATGPVFQHGVASGDPLSDRVILWTRVTPDADNIVEVTCQVSRDPEFRSIVARATTQASLARDFTVKLDIGGLEAATTYYYRFEALDTRSMTGRTRTLPAGRTEHVRLALASCANYPFGYFNAYRRIADRGDLDLVLHLGDYLYEYRNGEYGDGTQFNRMPLPDKEIVTLDDYRGRHAVYKTDPDLQAAHRQHPFIVVWDDHESANNSWSGGAENHHPEKGEGEWAPRKAAAVQAYYEWMPIREMRATRQLQIYRTFPLGDLADLVMLDTRLAGRDLQAARVTDLATMANPDRTLLGRSQEAWLQGELLESERAAAVWRLLGQQVMFAPTRRDDGFISNTDAWDGYPASRDRLLDFVTRNGIGNLVVLTGDVHSSWASDIARDPFSPAGYDPETGRGAVAVEVVAPAVTSPGPFARYSPEEARARTDAILSANRHVKMLDGLQRGDVVLDVTRDRIQADWYFVPRVDERSRIETHGASFVVATGANHLRPARRPSGTLRLG